jgi:hypothetical protein
MLQALIDLNRLLEIGRYHKNALEKRTAVLSKLKQTAIGSSSLGFAAVSHIHTEDINRLAARFISSVSA